MPSLWDWKLFQSWYHWNCGQTNTWSENFRLSHMNDFVRLSKDILPIVYSSIKHWPFCVWPQTIELHLRPYVTDSSERSRLCFSFSSRLACYHAAVFCLLLAPSCLLWCTFGANYLWSHICNCIHINIFPRHLFHHVNLSNAYDMFRKAWKREMQTKYRLNPIALCSVCTVQCQEGWKATPPWR